MFEDTLAKLDNFYASHKTIHHKKGDTILRPGDEPPGVFYLKKGYARLYSVSASGEELTMIIFQPGDLFPLTWTINLTPNIYYLEAMTNSDLGFAPRKEFLDFIRENISIGFDVTSRILHRFNGLLERMEHLVFGNAYNKVAMILFLSALRFGEKTDEGSMIPFQFTHKDIASLTGMTRETVSIEMKKLERNGLITNKRKYLVIKDLKKLKSAYNINSTSSSKAKRG